MSETQLESFQRVVEQKVTKYTPEQIAEHKARIDKMSHYEMAELRRFGPIGHIYFNYNLPFYLHFENRFQTLGGMTPEISKKLQESRGIKYENKKQKPSYQRKENQSRREV